MAFKDLKHIPVILKYVMCSPTCRTRSTEVDVQYLIGWYRKAELGMQDWICRTQHAVFDLYSPTPGTRSTELDVRDSTCTTRNAEPDARNSTRTANAMQKWATRIEVLDRRNLIRRAQNVEHDVRTWICRTRKVACLPTKRTVLEL